MNWFEQRIQEQPIASNRLCRIFEEQLPVLQTPKQLIGVLCIHFDTRPYYNDFNYILYGKKYIKRKKV